MKAIGRLCIIVGVALACLVIARLLNPKHTEHVRFPATELQKRAWNAIAFANSEGVNVLFLDKGKLMPDGSLCYEFTFSKFGDHYHYHASHLASGGFSSNEQVYKMLCRGRYVDSIGPMELMDIPSE